MSNVVLKSHVDALQAYKDNILNTEAVNRREKHGRLLRVARMYSTISGELFPSYQWVESGESVALPFEIEEKGSGAWGHTYTFNRNGIRWHFSENRNRMTEKQWALNLRVGVVDKGNSYPISNRAEFGRFLFDHKNELGLDGVSVTEEIEQLNVLQP